MRARIEFCAVYAAMLAISVVVWAGAVFGLRALYRWMP